MLSGVTFRWGYSSLLASPTPGPAAILTILQYIGAATTLTCNEVDKALELELDDEERQALKELHKSVESLKSGTTVYKVLLNAMKKDADIDERSPYQRSPYSRFIQQISGKRAMESLERVFKATRSPLESEFFVPTINPSGSKRALKFLLDVLKANLRPGDLHELIGDLKDVTDEIFLCQQNNESAFKAAWYCFVVAHQWIDRRPSVNNIGDIQDRVWQAFDCVLGAFSSNPFALSPESVSFSRVKVPAFAILNRSHEAATRHEAFARLVGKAWVDDRVSRYDDQVQQLGSLQTSLFDLLWSGTVEQLKQRDGYSPDDPERPEFERTVGGLERVLQGAIVRLREQHCTIAFCGTVEADKSLFLNALMGRAILPSDELPPVVWPCRLRHVQGQDVPQLRFRAKRFVVALKKLQDLQYGRKMQTYHPLPENVSEAPLSDARSELSDEEVLLRTIHNQWVDLHAVTRENLLKFETPEFRLREFVVGEQEIKIMLGQLNDIVRLCQRFDLKVDMSKVDWPLLTVEFNSVHGDQMDGIYEFIDLPGIGEGFSDTNFESLAHLVASDSNAIVPIVSFKENSRSEWKRLPELVMNGFNRRADVVVFTHLDQISQGNMDEQLKTVTETFWPRGALNTNRVIPCSSLMGLSARDLLDKSHTTKPPFETVWNKPAVGYHCAAKILGVEDPRAAYDRLDSQIWRDKLQAELHASGIITATQKLTKEMADSVRINALLSEADTVIKELGKISTFYRRPLLLEATRIETEYDATKESCDLAREISQYVLDTLGTEESTQTQEISLLLEQEFGMINQKANELINQTIKKISTNCGMSLDDMDVDHGTLGASRGKRGSSGVQVGNGETSGKVQSAEAGYSSILITETKAQAKDFLHLCQQELSSALETLKREYTAIVLDLVGAADSELLDLVRGMAKEAKLQPPPEGWENRIGNFVPASLHIEGIAFQEFRGVINRRYLSFFNRQYSIEIGTLHDRFKNEIIDPWVRKLKEEGEKTLLTSIQTSFSFAKDWMTPGLLERKDQCKQELKKKNTLVGEERVECLTAMYGNLLAAEEALTELRFRVEALQKRSGK